VHKTLNGYKKPIIVEEEMELMVDDVHSVPIPTREIKAFHKSERKSFLPMNS